MKVDRFFTLRPFGQWKAIAFSRSRRFADDIPK